MPNYKIVIEYDGTNFFGWQYQLNQRTAQSEIEYALKKLNNGEPIRIHGAGRTDTGVHARGQVANFSIEKTWVCEKYRRAINGNIGEDIRIKSCEMVSDDFHARYSALRRRYHYYCRTDQSIIDRNYVWQVPENLDLEKMQTCANLIKGENDFTSFCKYSPDLENRRCTFYQSEWIKRKDFLIYRVEANRFLHHLIRYLVGTMVEVGRGKIEVNGFEKILNSKDFRSKVFKAPSSGLFLEEVIYD
ncbi:MAG: tRNA pseudouridine(38-40) synthase TruA [Candidatus Marinimicrobia bacterium]|nr:tRNA pseudouridine(38-40) synthase TruA [Candidatus Neomarinimicrobiota bacterium]MBL7047020.1 tRNA pseudouridine(38-40) synthase TruA [Candidatus Neomarinimicrobiota bacterium]